MSNWKNKLQNPFALVGQGFLVGVLLFWATAPQEASATALASSAAVATGSTVPA